MAEQQKTNLNKTELLKVLPVDEDEIWHILSILLDPQGFDVFVANEYTFTVIGEDCTITKENFNEAEVFTFDDNGYARKNYADQLYKATLNRMKAEKRFMRIARQYLRMNEFAQRYREAKRLQNLAQEFKDAS